MKVGSYPYGAAITRDGKHGLVSNEADGTVSVIDLATAKKVKDIQVGPHLSHPEGIATDPKADRAYVAVTQQDLIAVIDTQKLTVERTLSVERPAGASARRRSRCSVTSDGCFLLSADSGEDALAVFALPNAPRTHVQRTSRSAGGARARRSSRRSSIIRHEARRRRAAAGQARGSSLGRVPVGSYPVDADARPAPPDARVDGGEGAGRRAEPERPQPAVAERLRRPHQQLPVPAVDRRAAASGILRFPTDRGCAG